MFYWAIVGEQKTGVGKQILFRNKPEREQQAFIPYNSGTLIVLGFQFGEAVLFARLVRHKGIPTSVATLQHKIEQLMRVGRNGSMSMVSDPKKERREMLLPIFYDYWINQ